MTFGRRIVGVLWALACVFTSHVCRAADPVHSAWILGPADSPHFPDVHSVTTTDQYIIVRSAGISRKYLGPLQSPPIPAEAAREFTFRIPLHPEPGAHARVPIDIVGTFVNGIPIYNQFEALSWNGANLWHYDAVANNDDGTLTAAGHPRVELTHPAAPGLLEQLIADGRRHSPLIGFALDGYPVYGPWAYDADGRLRRMRSSYRLRNIARRHLWPDGTQLTPEQYGPDVSADNPLGTFAEDYEYIAGSGDLDEFNGRFTATPEYPDGTYAYFLTTEAAGRLAYPYLIGPRFYGEAPMAAARGSFPIAKQGIELRASESKIVAGKPVRFRLEARDTHGDPIRHFEYVHERPIHFVIASADLKDFAHIHPELAPDDSYEVTHTFPRGGHYRMWADYSLPGESPRVDSFDITVSGLDTAQALAPNAEYFSMAAWRGNWVAPASDGARAAKAAGQVAKDDPASHGQGGLSPCCGQNKLHAQAKAYVTQVTLTPSKPLRAGEDIPMTLSLSGPTETLEPYLGAWAHAIVVSQDLRTFTHVHPIETAMASTGGHAHTVSGPPPAEIHIVTSFPSPGLYKLWAQFQQAGEVLTIPFELQVDSAATAKQRTTIPPDALHIHVTAHGYDPPSFTIPANTPLTLAVTRESAPNCGSEIVFPALGIRKRLPLGETVLIQLPGQPAGEIAFSCGMGMFRGMIVAR